MSAVSQKPNTINVKPRKRAAITPQSIEVFTPPGKETLLIAKNLHWLFRKEENPNQKKAVDSWFRQFALSLLVAPMTQFSFFSFDLNAHLFLVMHTSIVAKISHFFMIAVNFFFMMINAHLFSAFHGIAASDTTTHPLANGATFYAVCLMIWYSIISFQEGLHLWGAISIALVSALWRGVTLSLQEGAWFADPMYAIAGCFVSAFIISIGHSAEEYVPPRFNFTEGWMKTIDHVGRNFIYCSTVQVLGGTFSEMAASARLMPYNVLFLMFRLGYQPEKWTMFNERAKKAWESGNPALDYIGTGGGSCLDYTSLAQDSRGLAIIGSGVRAGCITG